MKTQYDRIAALLTRKTGATSMELVRAARTVSPHKRLSEMKQKGWIITRRAMLGCTHGVYFGIPPKGTK